MPGANLPDTAHEEVQIAASPSLCFGIAADFEEYPTWADDVKSVTVLEHDTDGRATQVEYHASALGRSVRYVLAYDFADAPRAFSWSLVEGDLVRAIDGRYAFAPRDGGTLVTYDLRVDLALPLPGIVKRKAAGMITGTALQGLKRVAEGGA
ncbi:MAG TPA: SRPBCC family protein [Acidimicrobiia bacterium]|nr:SRPBCC family protein [Acidimicrobiia bacterium]